MGSRRLAKYKAYSFTVHTTDEKQEVAEELQAQREKQREFYDINRSIEILNTDSFDNPKKVTGKVEPPFPMLSCWMKKIPEELFECGRYSVLACPKGSRRILMIDRRHKARCFNIWGRALQKHFLPELKGVTILDCIYDKNANVFYVLDTICYNKTVMTACEFSLRQSWVQDNFSGVERQKPAFKTIPHLPSFDKSCLAEFTKRTFHFELDGYLFYRNDSTYEFGISDKSLWLLPDMVDELFYSGSKCGHLTAYERMELAETDHSEAQEALRRRQDLIDENTLDFALCKLCI